MAIFITGDTHADFERFKKDVFYEQAELSKNDYVIICGDFGGVWDGSPRERYWLDWLEAKLFTTLFVSGNHENYDLLSEFPVQKWHGGRVQFIRPSIVHLMRGQIYEIEGKRFFTMGGASSHDSIVWCTVPCCKIYWPQADRSVRFFRLYHGDHHWFYRGRNGYRIGRTLEAADRDGDIRGHYSAAEHHYQ